MISLRGILRQKQCVLPSIDKTTKATPSDVKSQSASSSPSKPDVVDVANVGFSATSTKLTPSKSATAHPPPSDPATPVEVVESLTQTPPTKTPVARVEPRKSEWIWTGVWAFGEITDEMLRLQISPPLTEENPAQTTPSADTPDNANSPQHPAAITTSTTTTTAPTTTPTAVSSSLTTAVTSTPPSTGKKGRRPNSVTSSTSSVSSPAAPRPFEYKFEEVVDPSKIPVPSSVESAAQKEASSEEPANAAEAFSSTKQTTKSIEGDSVTATISNRTTNQSEKKDSFQSSKETQLKDTSPDFNSGKVTTDAAGRSKPPDRGTQQYERDSCALKSEGQKTTPPDAATAKSAGNAQSPGQISPMEVTPEATGKTGGDNTQSSKELSSQPEKTQTASTTDGKKEGSSPVATFASAVPGEMFTDASKLYPDKCPVGGRWEGYFENTTKRKDRHTTRIPETFYLFFNSTPSFQARVTFPTRKDNQSEEASPKASTSSPSADDKETKSDAHSEGALPAGHVHVRGMGSNQFGTFELVGGFDPVTGVLTCQRSYVSVETASATGPPRTRRSSSAPLAPLGVVTRVRSGRSKRSSFAAPDSPAVGDGTKKSYYTRKRNISWGRRSSYDDDDDDDEDETGKKNSGSARKKQKSSSSTSDGSNVKTPVSQSKATSLGPSTVSSEGKGKSMSEGSKHSEAMKTNADGSGEKSLAPGTTKISQSDQVKSSRPSPSPSVTASNSKKALKSADAPPRIGNDVAAASAEPSSPFPEPETEELVLPVVGDDKDARWKAAHYMYYQRKTELPAPEGTPGGTHTASTSHVTSGSVGAGGATAGITPSAGATTISFVVYEGEMMGDQVREGRGVCLYNNGTLYEGEWKKNKEHGHGVLMSADRRRVIYDGEWERGRMHGRGTYYYYEVEGQPNSSAASGGVYSGDFKENARYGNGVYTLPDQSTYDGEWRDDVPSGRGTFYWTDGSVYVGQWKDGKRHGQGSLKCCDGFSYEGFWVDNGMEGRGSAVYPKGQRYEGLWVGGRREGRGTIHFTNGAVYEGRFRDDVMEGQGTLKMENNVWLSGGWKEHGTKKQGDGDSDDDSSMDLTDRDKGGTMKSLESDPPEWMIPIEFQSDMGHIHQKAGFTMEGK